MFEANERLEAGYRTWTAFIWRRFRLVNGARYESSFTRGSKRQKGKKETWYFKYPCWQTFDTSNTAQRGWGNSEKKRVSDDVSDVAHERPFIRPQRDIYWGKRESEREKERGKEGTTRRGLCNLYLGD